MKWKKEGLILKAEGQREWMESHIQNPYAIDMGEYIRVYFTTREKPKSNLYKASIAFMDLDRDNVNKVIRIAEEPVLEFGSIGSFDEFGVMPGAIMKRNHQIWMYYVGWMRTCSAPYSWSIGLAISEDEGMHFERFSEGPVLGRTYDDPYLQNGCTSVIEKDEILYMHYSSGVRWLQSDIKDKWESQYLLRRATSIDGINWIRDKDFCVERILEDESQTSPTIIEIHGKYHMFFPYRHSLEFRNSERSYRIGYAYSDDLISWTRDDSKVGIDVSATGWDSEMVCYPHVTNIDGRIIMFYCGNGFGRGGLGYAVLEN